MIIAGLPYLCLFAVALLFFLALLLKPEANQESPVPDCHRSDFYPPPLIYPYQKVSKERFEQAKHAVKNGLCVHCMAPHNWCKYLVDASNVPTLEMIVSALQLEIDRLNWEQNQTER